MNPTRVYRLVLLMIIVTALLLGGWAWFLGYKAKKTQAAPHKDAELLFNTPLKAAKAFISHTTPLKLQEQAATSSRPSFTPTAQAIVTEPIAGYRILYQKQSDTLIDTIAYATVKNGHVFFMTLTETPSVRRVLQQTIPATQEALFFERGKVVLRRYFEEKNGETHITSALQPLSANSTATFLPRNITTIARLPYGEATAWITVDDEGATLFATDHITDTPRAVWRSSLSHWRIAWWGNDALALWQSPLAQTGSALFRIAINGEDERIITHRKVGLSVRPVASSSLLLSYMEDNELTTTLWTAGEENTLPIHTIAEKCVADVRGELVWCFVPKRIPHDAALMDRYLRGELSFADELMSVNLNTGTTTRPFASSTVAIDATDVRMNPSGTAIYARDRKTDQLWRFTIRPATIQ